MTSMRWSSPGLSRFWRNPRQDAVSVEPPARRSEDFGEGEAGKIQLMEGPYGPYLTNGELNASLPKGTAAEELDRPEAVRILNEHGKKPKRGRRRRSK